MSTIATINGTDAADTITFTATSTTVNAGEGANTITGTSGDNEINAGGGVDTISLTSGDNTILAGEGANTITATLGNNVISSGDGADTITVTSGNNIINAGGGANTIVATSGINVINTGDGADTITTGGLADGGNTINAGDGANTITTGAGDDTITGGNGADTITTGAGNDVVDAGNGANTVTTGAGNDIVYSGVDTDTITTGAGDDEIHIKGGTDTIAAGAGTDTLIVDFSLATGAVSINTLAGTAAAGYAGNISGLGIATFAGVENFEITSGDFNDTITTGDGNDVVHAGAGSDIVNLAGGDDEAIYTMGANYDEYDVYQGGDGVDTLTLEFTEEEWSLVEVRDEVARYQAHLVEHSADTFVFGESLEVSEFERLNVRIGDGDAEDMTVAPVDDIVVGTFDDITTDNYGAVPNGYLGLNWSGFSLINAPNYFTQDTGYVRGNTSPDYVVYAYNTATVSGVGDDEFEFVSTTLTAAWNDNLNIDINGYRDGLLIYETTVIVSDDEPTVFTFNWDDVDEVTFSPYGGTIAGTPGGGDFLAMDDISFA